MDESSVEEGPPEDALGTPQVSRTEAEDPDEELSVAEMLEAILEVALDLRAGLDEKRVLELFLDATRECAKDWGYLLAARPPRPRVLVRVHTEFPLLADALPDPAVLRSGRLPAVRRAYAKLAAHLPTAGSLGYWSAEASQGVQAAGGNGLVGWNLRH
jgi:hypothetical protein